MKGNACTKAPQVAKENDTPVFEYRKRKGHHLSKSLSIAARARHPSERCRDDREACEHIDDDSEPQSWPRTSTSGPAHVEAG